MNGLQWSVVAFFSAIWAALTAILVAAPAIYSLALGSVPPVAFFAAISLLIAACVVGVARRWRWVFWLILGAFLAGAFRVVASALQLGGAIPIDNPAAPKAYATRRALTAPVRVKPLKENFGAPRLSKQPIHSQ